MKAAIQKTYISTSLLTFQTKNNKVWAEPTPAPFLQHQILLQFSPILRGRLFFQELLRTRALHPSGSKKIKNYREWHHDRDIWRASIQEGTCLHQRQTHGAPCRSMPTLQHPRDARTRSRHGVIAQHPRQRQGWSPPCSCQPGPGFKSAPTQP